MNQLKQCPPCPPADLQPPGSEPMATFDEAFPAAIQELGERGLLLNVQLSRMADGDDELSQEIRDALIAGGLAQDRYGVGLAKSSDFDARRSLVSTRAKAESGPSTPDDVVFAALPEEEWWLMSGGVTSGPFTLAAIGQMRRRGQILKSDMIRQGERGMWQLPDVIADLPEEPEDELSSRRSLAFFASPETKSQQPTPSMNASDSDAESKAPTARKSTRTSADADDGVEYYLWDAGNPAGPYTRAEVQSRLDSGRLDADDFVQVGKDGDWQPVSQALGAGRSTHRISQAASDSKELAVPSSVSPNRSSASIPARRSTTIRAVKQAPEPAARPTKSPLVHVWNQAARLVGGEMQLLGIVASTACVVALVIWWRQPPSASSVYQQVEATYNRLTEAKRQRGPKLSTVVAEELPRIRELRDSLNKRASATQPVLQELLWACDYGLLPLLEHPQDTDSEHVLTGHMGRALLALDPKKAAEKGIKSETPASETPASETPTGDNPQAPVP